MPTHNVVLAEHHGKVSNQPMKSGRYRNGSEMLREILSMIEQREQRDTDKLKMLLEAASIALTDLEEGRFRDFATLDEFEDYLTHTTEDMLTFKP